MQANIQGYKNISISTEGLNKLLELKSSNQFPGQNFIWTDDIHVELPIKLGVTQLERITAVTLVEQWQNTIAQFGDFPALSVKRENKWVTLTYKQYYDECVKFSKALLATGVKEFSTVNITGFNSPQWAIAYFGSIFARFIPVGIYSTNSLAACQYIAGHSETRIIVAENKQLASKYYGLLKKGEIDRIILYGQEPGNDHFDHKIVTWKTFMALGKDISIKQVNSRMNEIKPGNCCTLIYTSGTTGMPKGVMISHDNMVWASKASGYIDPTRSLNNLRMISYLPLSHAAGQFIDLTRTLIRGHHVFFAEPTALQGTLFQTVQQVRPQGFFAVPRIWEKLYDKLMELSKSNTGILSKISSWAKGIGEEGTLKELRGQQTSFQFKLAKKIVFNKIKKALGLDQCISFAFGSAPLDPVIRKYFASINIFLLNGYGMTQCTAPQSMTDPLKFSNQTLQSYLEVGSQMPGTQLIIHKLNKNDQDGEICMRGRHVFMGYFKNAEQTSKTIDSEGFLHSGDLGKLTKQGSLFITGRVKELIITAGGQNIPPILIENQIKNILICLSNVMAIGDNRKYLTCLISLKEDPPLSGNLEKGALQFLKSKGLAITKVAQAINNKQFRTIILEGLKAANNKAISRAQHVQQFYLMPEDFSVQSGTLTPTLKLKRKEAMKKYATQIQSMYINSKL